LLLSENIAYPIAEIFTKRLESARIIENHASV
jgi:hypothetical protein